MLPDVATTIEAVPTATALVDATGSLSCVLVPTSAGAVESDTVIAASGQLSVIPSVQRIRMGAQRAGQPAHVWVDEHSVHILIDGELVKTVPSNLNAEDLRHLALRGARPAGPPPAPAAPARLDALPAGTVIELDRSLDAEGKVRLATERVKIGTELAHQRVTLRLDGHLVHVVHNGILAKTLAAPIDADQRTSLRGARIATNPSVGVSPPASPSLRGTRTGQDGHTCHR